MTSIPSGQFTFSAANKPINVVVTPNGQNMPPPVPGDFNLEVVTGNANSLAAGYQALPRLSNGGHSVERRFDRVRFRCRSNYDPARRRQRKSGRDRYGGRN